jgi:hypothetical protein
MAWDKGLWDIARLAPHMQKQWLNEAVMRGRLAAMKARGK